MNRTTRIVLLLVGLVVLIGIGVAVYVWVSGGSGEASREIDAPTLEIAPTGESVPDPAATEEASGESAATDESASVAATGDVVLFRIQTAESQVRFKLDEDLSGNRITVLGSTNQIAGDIAVDFANPENSQLGTIRINMRTLATDNEFRNRAIRSQILRTAQGEFEFSDFVPTSVEGLPETVAVGDTINFSVTGDFTANGVTAPITFDVTLTIVSEDRLEGSARSVVQRADFNLNIPSVPNVANVEEEVELEFDFVATAVES